MHPTWHCSHFPLVLDGNATIKRYKGYNGSTIQFTNFTYAWKAIGKWSKYERYERSIFASRTKEQGWVWSNMCFFFSRHMFKMLKCMNDIYIYICFYISETTIHPSQVHLTKSCLGTSRSSELRVMEVCKHCQVRMMKDACDWNLQNITNSICAWVIDTGWTCRMKHDYLNERIDKEKGIELLQCASIVGCCLGIVEITWSGNILSV